MGRQASAGSTWALFTAEATWQVVEQQVAAAQRYGAPLSCAVVELSPASADDDASAEGDSVPLPDVAARIMGVLRKADIIGQIGRQQLCVLFPHTSYRDALLAADRMVSHALGGPAPTRAAIGISSLDDCDSAEKLVSHARVALRELEDTAGVGAFIYLGPSEG